MKHLKLFVFAFFAFFATSAFSQIQIGAQIGPQIPFEDGYKVGFGFNLNGKYFATENIAVGINVGRHGIGTGNSNVSTACIPITGLAEYHFGDSELKPFVGMDLGIYIFKVKMKGWGSSSDAYFGLAPKIGAAYFIQENIALTGDLKFNIVTGDGSFTYMGINIGAVFQF